MNRWVFLATIVRSFVILTFLNDFSDIFIVNYCPQKSLTSKMLYFIHLPQWSMISSLVISTFIKWEIRMLNSDFNWPWTYTYSPVFIMAYYFSGFWSRIFKPKISLKNINKIMLKSVRKDTYSGWYGSRGKTFSLLSQMFPNFRSHFWIKFWSSRNAPSVHFLRWKSKSMFVQEYGSYDFFS